jgi:hypothetical protein
MSHGFSTGHVPSVQGESSAVLAQAKTRKRAKHVFDTGEIPHLWAHKVQESARNAQGNLYFNGDNIFSYGSHFPIARHVVDNPTKKHPKPAVLFTTRSYSVTTSGHISAVRSAIPKDVPVFHVYDPSLTRHSMGLHVDGYVRSIELTAKAASQRKMETTRNEDVQRALSLVAECKAFCKFFGLKLPTFAKLPKIDAEKLARQKQAIENRQKARDIKQRAEWETRQARAKAEADAWNASGICKHTPKHDAHVYGDIWKCDKQREDEEWIAKSADIIAAWRNGDSQARLRDPWNLPVMLRIRTFGADENVQHAVAMVETSRGAQVPVSHAIRGLRFVRAVIARGEAFQTNGHTFHLGHYKIDRVETDGTLHAGCHVISLAEIERIAPELERIAGTEDTSGIARG